MVDEHKICFILCSNKEYFLEECLLYIGMLDVPEGYTIDAISIGDAKSMTSGYNEAMQATDAKYKIYLHQDVFIIYKGFLQAILDIFASDDSIGMIGMAGAPKMSPTGIMWCGYRVGQLYGDSTVQKDYSEYQYSLRDGLHEVDAIDGLMMITNRDIPWREDIFDGWDFYDVSQSMEFRKAGYKVVVPEQLSPWVKHDDGILNLSNYNRYRKICMAEYPEYFYPQRFEVGKNNVTEGNKLTLVIMARNQWSVIQSRVEIIENLRKIQGVQIVVVDNGSEDELRHWLRNQRTVNYLICGEMEETYTAIMDEVKKQFVDKEDLLIWSADLLAMSGNEKYIRNALRNKNSQFPKGAVFASGKVL